MNRTLIALLLSCAALWTAANAQGRKAKDPCADAQSQAEMNICSAKKLKAADEELNRVYNRLTSVLSEDAAQRDRLKTAETAWIKYRDDNCEYESAVYEGGSIRPLIYNLCMERMTKARTAELRSQIKELAQ